MEQNTHGRSFTEEDNKIILEYVKTEDSLQDAFYRASVDINKSVKSIISHYYRAKYFKSYIASNKERRKKVQERIKKQLIKEIRKSPENLTKAFKETAKKQKVPMATVVSGYYKDSTRFSRNNLGMCFALTSGEKVLYNSKNSQKNQPKVESSITKKIINLIKKLFE